MTSYEGSMMTIEGACWATIRTHNRSGVSSATVSWRFGESVSVLSAQAALNIVGSPLDDPSAAEIGFSAVEHGGKFEKLGQVLAA